MKAYSVLRYSLVYSAMSYGGFLMKKSIFLCTLVASLTACNHNQKENIITQNEQIEVLQTQVETLQAQITEINSIVKSLHPMLAVFTPSSKGYQPLYTDKGNLIISLDELKKYANGYKATFLIGNPNHVTFDGIKLSVHWGKYLSEKENFTDWQQNLQSEDINIGKTILPGTWNKVTVIMSPATANNVGTILLSLESDNIDLSMDTRRDTT